MIALGGSEHLVLFAPAARASQKNAITHQKVDENTSKMGVRRCSPHVAPIGGERGLPS